MIQVSVEPHTLDPAHAQERETKTRSRQEWPPSTSAEATL